MSSTTLVNDIAGRALDEVRDAVATQPEPVPAAFRPIVSWVVLVLITLINSLETVFRAIAAALEQVAPPPPAHGPSPPSPVAPPPPAGFAAAASEPQQRTKAAHNRRCAQCHARGHDASECRTANPSAMRKRVARNNRTAKEARRERAATAHVAPSAVQPTPAPLYHPGLYAPPPPPIDYAAFMADSTELRRRAQSARDKRHRQAPVASAARAYTVRGAARAAIPPHPPLSPRTRAEMEAEIGDGPPSP